MSKYSRAFRAFMKIKTLKPSRSLFDLSHSLMMTADMGKCYPLPPMEMSPGDTFHIWQEMVVRMQPLNAPILHDVNVYVHWFFVPYRILWDEWTTFISGSVDGSAGGSSVGELPSVSPQLPRWEPSEGKNGVGSLWDYMGFPTGVNPVGAYPLDFTRRAYNMVWNEYYRDENLQEEVSLSNEDIKYRNWAKDYFTSGLLSQQRGITPALPVGGNGTSRSYTSSITTNLAAGVFDVEREFDVSSFPDEAKVDDILRGAVISPDGFISNFSFSFVSYNYETQKVKFYLSGTNNEQAPLTHSFVLTLNFVTLSNGFSADIKDLRVAFQIQRWMELANRGGVRYTEFLRSFFGVSPRDDRLQRPEYVGGFRAPVIISEVLQTSSTSGEPTPQGNMAGHGIGASRNYVGSYTAVEYGLLLPIFSIMPSAKYQQGINKQWLRRSKYDFLFPQFTGLSEQAIEQAEIFAEDTEAKNRRVFAFNEIYDELRAIPSKVLGKMRTTFDYWHLGRKFESAPSMNSDFIECKPSKRIFAAPSEDGFIVSVGNLIRAVRPLPKYGTPKGV